MNLGLALRWLSPLALLPSLAVAQQPVAPPSASVLQGTRPVFRWVGGDANAAVELSQDRDFSRVAVTLAGVDRTAAARDDLPRGAWFWRVRGAAGTSPVWTFAAWGRAPRAGAWGFTTDTDGDGRAEILTPDARGAARRFTTGPGGDSLPLPRGARCAELRAVGDVNGDGFVDVLATTSVGPSVVLGHEYAPRIAPSFTVPPAARATLTPVGDADLDGFADLAFATALPTGTRITLLRGGARGFTPTTLGVVPVRGPVEARLPASLGAAWDTDGDGRPELLLTRRGASTPSRDVSVLLLSLDPARLGAPRAVLRADPRMVGPYDDGAQNSGFGLSLTGLGDVNGDGFGDLAVGSGDCFALYLGRAEAPAPQASAVICSQGAGLNNQPFTGSLLRAAGDLNGDGFSDLLAGEGVAGADSSGRVSVFLGGSQGPTAMSVRLGYEDSRWSGQGFGSDTFSPGDVNGDGLADVAVRASGYNPVGQFDANHTGVFFYPGAARAMAEPFAWWVALP